MVLVQRHDCHSPEGLSGLEANQMACVFALYLRIHISVNVTSKTVVF